MMTMATNSPLSIERLMYFNIHASVNGYLNQRSLVSRELQLAKD
jgi:hypothetical protein